MSDSVTNVEIEDVLSSIRRLVAEGDGRRILTPARAARAQETPATEPESSKFILTPALRVAEGDVPDTTVDDAAGPLVLGGDDAPFIEVGEGSGPRDAAGTIHALHPGTRDWSRLEETIAELEAAVTQQPDEWEPDGSEKAPVLGWHAPEVRAGMKEAFDAAEVAFQHKPAVPAPLMPAPADTVSNDTVPSATPPADTVSADTVPTHTVPTDPATEAQATADSGDRDIPDHETGDDDAPRPSQGTDGIIDEEMLRAMVIDVIRQELQGQMGEKITRNVRKMVHREIFRVLASQDVD